MKKEEFEVKELKTNSLLETKKKLMEEQRKGAVHFSVQNQVSFQWKNPDFLLKNVNFLLKNVNFLLKYVNFVI